MRLKIKNKDDKLNDIFENLKIEIFSDRLNVITSIEQFN